jgi:hypothetical protein
MELAPGLVETAPISRTSQGKALAAARALSTSAKASPENESADKFIILKNCLFSLENTKDNNSNYPK